MKKTICKFLVALLIVVSIGCMFVACDHTHSYTVVKEATCTEDGLKKCSCGSEQTIKALGHDYDEEDVCKRCGEKKPSPIVGVK